MNKISSILHIFGHSSIDCSLDPDGGLKLQLQCSDDCNRDWQLKDYKPTFSYMVDLLKARSTVYRRAGH